MVTGLRSKLAHLASSRRIAARSQRRGARGMTLIEIMVVLVILGLIAGAIGYNVFNQLKVAQTKTATLDLRALSNGVDLFHVETGQYPEAMTELVPKYIHDIHKDPWGSEYQYAHTGDGYDVYSYGPDKQQGGSDDITVHGGEGGVVGSQAGK